MLILSNINISVFKSLSFPLAYSTSAVQFILFLEQAKPVPPSEPGCCSGLFPNIWKALVLELLWTVPLNPGHISYLLTT